MVWVRGWTSQSRQNARYPGWNTTVPVSRSRPTTSARAIVAEQRAWHATEMRKRRRHAFPPIVLALTEERFDEESPRVAEDRDEQEDAHPCVPDAHAFLAEVNLQLIAGRRFHADRGQLRHASRTPQVGELSLPESTYVRIH